MAQKDTIIPVNKITLSKAIANWEAEHVGEKLADLEEVDLIFRNIETLDSSISSLTNCRILSLSTNCIKQMIDINLPKLERISLGRNRIKRISGLTNVASTLKELWISYNDITTLDGLNDCTKLEKLYISNNNIAQMNELNKLVNCVNLIDVTFKGNPFMLVDGDIKKPQDKPFSETIPEIKKRIPSVVTVDGELCKNWEIK